MDKRLTGIGDSDTDRDPDDEREPGVDGERDILLTITDDGPVLDGDFPRLLAVGDR